MLYAQPRPGQEISTGKLDWLTVGLYTACVFAGWFNIFAAVYDPELHQSIFDFSINSGKQLFWIGSSLILILLIMIVDFKFFEAFAYIFYGLIAVALIGVIFLARDVHGAKAWFEIGSVRIQPSEFAKFVTALTLAKYLGDNEIKFDDTRTQLVCGAIIGIPALLILKQNDTGSALVFGAFILVLYREGLTPWVLILPIIAAVIVILSLIIEHLYLHIAVWVIIGLVILNLRWKSPRNILMSIGGGAFVSAMIELVGFFMFNVLQAHQRDRIMVLLKPETVDQKKIGWQVLQSKIAIGSGGFWGKGFLNGTQTKFDFVPAQSTDFIFATIGEEHGWIGGLIVFILIIGLLCRIVSLAERQRDRFSRVYGYSVACILFVHFAVNLGMAIGLLPVIGIPLPFFSYGGSSLWSFTILLWIFLKLDSHRIEVLSRL
ncbi:rod shape-determining protein RodA [Cytophagaceae bacterium YF14B1]|uniref:Cell wall polymerase n=1 Tax=Xanthocytophaga flava TaxID=3048013 RepID=A0AAE3U7E2_9BACT|nr:rod shape-determining protein RodA [Xanthocytophaga flavus]MDJ1481517.1 rod shape-determining protein RodA [Xanthocytophaga flavus]